MRFPDGAPQGVHALDTWLHDHPAVALHLLWSDAQGARTYSAWPTAMKERLWQYFDLIRSGQSPSLPDPPRNAWNYGPGDDPLAVHTLLTPEDALNLYLSTVAHSLVVDMDRRVPWSLDDLNETELEALFCSTSLFWWNARQQGFEIVSLRHGWAVPAPPQVGWEFLRSQGLLRSTRLETITALVGWCKGLSHFAGGTMMDNFEAFWGYRGDMPVSRALAGTRYAGSEFSSYPGYDQVRHYTAGCHGTVGLLINVLRSANIPAAYRLAGDAQVGHATIIFLSEDRALTHGDDPYSQLCVKVPPEDLLLDLPTYNAWLGPLASNPLPNVGRQALVAGLRYLSPMLLRTYEKDKANGVSHANGEVFGIFRNAFSLQELEASRLWERMDAELANGSGSSPLINPNPPTTVAASPPPPAMREKDDIAARELAAKTGASMATPPVPAPVPPPTTGGRDGGLLLQAETLKPTTTGGQTEAQDMQLFTSARWSGDHQLWWTGGKTGDTLTLTFAVNAPGVYRLATSFTRAPDYAVVSITVDGSATTQEKLDLYDTQVTKTGFLPLGEFKLGPGNHQLVITITGCNDAATPAYMVGIDELRFDRVD